MPIMPVTPKIRRLTSPYLTFRISAEKINPPTNPIKLITHCLLPNKIILLPFLFELVLFD